MNLSDDELIEKTFEELEKKGVLNHFQAKFISQVTNEIQNSENDKVFCLKPFKEIHESIQNEIASQIIVQYLTKHNLEYTLKTANYEFDDYYQFRNLNVLNKLEITDKSDSLHSLFITWKSTKDQAIKKNKKVFLKKLASRLQEIGIYHDKSKVKLGYKTPKTEESQRIESLESISGLYSLPKFNESQSPTHIPFQNNDTLDKDYRTESSGSLSGLYSLPKFNESQSPEFKTNHKKETLDGGKRNETSGSFSGLYSYPVFNENQSSKILNNDSNPINIDISLLSQSNEDTTFYDNSSFSVAVPNQATKLSSNTQTEEKIQNQKIIYFDQNNESSENELDFPNISTEVVIPIRDQKSGNIITPTSNRGSRKESTNSGYIKKVQVSPIKEKNISSSSSVDLSFEGSVPYDDRIKFDVDINEKAQGKSGKNLAKEITDSDEFDDFL